MISRRVAARYAEALFSVAQHQASVPSLRAELERLVALIQGAPDFAALLERPDLEAERKLAAAKEALAGRFTDTVMALLATLLRHRRGDHVAEVAAAFGELADDADRVVRAEAATARPLGADQRQRLVAALGRLTGRRVVLEERIEPEILAGVRVRVGDRLIDGSARGRLERLRRELVGVGGWER